MWDTTNKITDLKRKVDELRKEQGQIRIELRELIGDPSPVNRLKLAGKYDSLGTEISSLKTKIVESERLAASVKEAESFRDDWLEMLHKDREYLAGIANIRGKLSASDGAIRVDETGKEQNFLMERMRLRMLYYMATKYTLKPPLKPPLKP